MADAYEPYHVPQQSRRDKLRILSHSQNPSLDHTHFYFHPPPSSASLFPLVDSDFLSSSAAEPHSVGNFMGFLSGVTVPGSPSSSSAVVHGGDRACDQTFNGGDVLVFKPEPLSLSLSSHHAYEHNNNNNDLHRFGAGYEVVVPNGGGSVVSRGSGPSGSLGPFTGYASILKGSRFLKPAQQLLEEFCNVGRGIYSDRIDDEDSSPMFDPTVENLALSSGVGSGETGKKKSKLISMLDEVYKRYKQYYEQLQSVIASFECVAGLGNATPFANLALRALSKHFKCLKNTIKDQLQFTNKIQEQGQMMNSEKIESLRSSYWIQRQGLSDHQNLPPVWKPHRGLPERAVTVLRAWLFDHFLHPYPTDTDKLMLAKQTGLSRNQVSNWFINARVRLWKPMVEEIHMLETRQSDQRISNDDVSVTQRPPPYASPSKKTRNDDVPCGSGGDFAAGQDALGFSYGTQNVPVLSTNGVSLTLGLHHQNNGIRLTDPFPVPVNAAHRFDVGDGFEGHNRQFARGYVGSSSSSNNNQLLYDFVG